MALYLIACDLSRVEPGIGDRHAHMNERITSLFPIRLHELRTTWLVESELPSAEIRGQLTDLLTPEDGLLVARLSGDAAWTPGFRAVAQQWLSCAMTRA